MAYEIKKTAYPAVKPVLTIEADSLDDIASLTGMAEGSTCKVGNDTYVYDEVNGWGEPGAQGKELPDYPDTDGAYILTATVASGAVTTSWEAAE